MNNPQGPPVPCYGRPHMLQGMLPPVHTAAFARVFAHRLLVPTWLHSLPRFRRFLSQPPFDSAIGRASAFLILTRLPDGWSNDLALALTCAPCAESAPGGSPLLPLTVSAPCPEEHYDR